MMDAIHICLYGQRGYSFRYPKKDFHSWLRSAYSVESDDSENIQLSIDINDQIMGLVKISRTYWLVPDSEGGVEEELIVTIEGKALEKESSNQSRNSLCESWIEDYLPFAAVKRNLVDGERLSDLDPSKIDGEIISGIDDITGIGLLHKISRRLNYVKRKTLQSLAPDDKKEGLNALMELLNEIKKEKAEVNSDLKEKIGELESANEIVIQLQEEIENITRSDGSGNVELRMNYAIKQSELTSSRKSIHELTFQSLPFLIAGVPKNLSEWSILEVLESKKENERMNQNLDFLTLVLDESKLNKNTKKTLSLIASKLANNKSDKYLSHLSLLPLSVIQSIQNRHLVLGISDNDSIIKRSMFQAIERLNDFESAESELRKATVGLGISSKATKLKELAESVGHLQAVSASLRGKLKQLDEDKKLLESKINDIKQNEDSDSLLNRRINRIENLELLIDLVATSVRKEFADPLESSFLEGFELLSRKSGRLEEVKIDMRNYSTHLKMRGFDGNWLDRDLSATEKQHVGLSLLYALRKAALSSKYGLSLPVIIDTPTSRMDIEHKSWSVTRFYPNLSNQVVVFATSDDLANGLYDELIESKVLGNQLLIKETTENSVEVSSQELGTFFGGSK
jgi:DNA sulfur modification protein DndD